MTTVGYEKFFPEVLPHVQNCPEIVAYNAIRNSVIEFCTDTWYWQHSTFPVPVEVDVADYDPDLPLNTKLLGVLDAWLDGRPLRPVTEPKLRDIYWNRNALRKHGNPIFYYNPVPETVRLAPVPNVASQFDGLTMLVAVAPLRSSKTVECSVYERYAEAIAHGAIARLAASPNQAYTNPPLAVAMGHEFHFEKAEAKAWVQRNKTRAAPQLRFRGRAF